MRESLPITIIKKDQYGADVRLAEALSDVGYRLPGKHEPQQELYKSTPEEGLGKHATRIVYLNRGDGSGDEHNGWCGLPFTGDMLGVRFEQGVGVEYSYEQLKMWIEPVIKNLVDEEN